MPSGSYKAEHPLTTPPLKERTLYHIETLIDHFLNVSWGPVIPPGEAMLSVEASKGMNGYYHAAAEGAHAVPHRNTDRSLPERQLGTGHPAGRGHAECRGIQGHERLLPRRR